MYIDGSVNRYIYDVTDGTRTYTLSFTDAGSGTRTVAFEPCRGDVVGAKTAGMVITLANPATVVTLSAESLNLEVGGTANLTATVTPENSTDTLVWSVSPSGIVSISGGSVSALAAGNATITATAGSASATCAVVVTKAVLPVLYELPQETVFTAGADGIIDTGVRLFQDVSTKPAYTILFDVTCGQNLTTNPSAGETCVLFHCLEESLPWPGLVGHAAGTDVSFQINMYSSSKTITPFCKGERIRCALVLDGENWYFASDRYPTETDYNKPSLIGGYKTAVAKSLLIGGYQKSDGTHGRFFDGTLHSFKVLRGAYTMAECQEWVNGTE